MSRNLILCADGTGNAFARQTSNVSRLVRLVGVGADDQQLVIYDQGIGTDPSLAQAARLYADGLGNARDRLIAKQHVKEVWFRGFHSDVGGGRRGARDRRDPPAMDAA